MPDVPIGTRGIDDEFPSLDTPSELPDRARVFHNVKNELFTKLSIISDG